MEKIMESKLATKCHIKVEVQKLQKIQSKKVGVHPFFIRNFRSMKKKIQKKHHFSRESFLRVS